MTDLTPRERITKAELKRIFRPGLKVRLTNCLMGPCDKPREVEKQTSYGFVMKTDKGPSYLRLEAGEHVTRAGLTITIFDKVGTLVAEYKVEEGQ